MRGGGGGVFKLTPDSNNPGHFMSHQDMSLYLLALDEKPAAPDQFISQDGKAPDSCSKCHYIYTSAADSGGGGGGGGDQRLFHGGAASKAPAEHVCSYSSEDVVCGLQFNSYYALMEHKTTVGHTCSHGRQKKRIDIYIYIYIYINQLSSDTVVLSSYPFGLAA